MSSRNVIKVSFEVVDVSDADILRVTFEDEAHSVKQINLNDDVQCQADLKDAFLLMAQLMVDNDLDIQFVESKS